MVCGTAGKAAIAFTLLAALTAGSRASDAPSGADDSPPVPAPYAFSDELGGFRILSVVGIGTPDNPVRIEQEFFTASPAIMVIRATLPINPFGSPDKAATGTIHVVLDIVNDSGVPWIGLEMELEEHLHEPSVYGDGLSFDQRRLVQDAVSSDAFARAHTDFEPYDRLLFDNGALDAKHRAQFRFLITDPTPRGEFYLQLDPRIPAS